jgi:hydroxymethylpyrimidine pyrophosphatase-like HAD family hydrolase
VIGDWLNDLDMFKASHFSIAMGNAPEELKAEADLIAPTNDEGGVAWALREIIRS